MSPIVLQTEVIAIRDQLEALYHSQRCKSDRCGTCSVNVCTDAELDRTVCSTDFGTPPRCKAQTGQFLSETQTSVKVRAGCPGDVPAFVPFAGCSVLTTRDGCHGAMWLCLGPVVRWRRPYR